VEERLMPGIRLKSQTGESIPIDLQHNGGDAFTARIDDDSVEGSFELSTSTSGVLRLRDRVVPCHFVRKNSDIEIWVGGQTYVFEAESAKGRASQTAPGSLAEEILAPMPGTVLRIDVKEGETFAAHQPLIIMESMKMEMTLSAPHAGRIARIACAVGELVPMGKVLAKLQAVENSADIPVKS
jgi:biotin carboxyl carrier protein